jgi:nicotinate dehydrogenase subunit A
MHHDDEAADLSHGEKTSLQHRSRHVPRYQLNINGKTQSVNTDSDTPLLYALRDELGLHGTKFGCGLGQCGACTVMINGEATRSCLTPVSSVGNKAVTTLEGLSQDGKPSRLQQAFIDEQAAQCGYCINGMIMTSTALLKRKPNPSESEIKEALAGNLCRCGTHQRICAAVKRAATA